MQHSFFWRTSLETNKIEEIQNWINGLSKKEQELLELLLQDVRDDTEWETEYQHNQ